MTKRVKSFIMIPVLAVGLLFTGGTVYTTANQSSAPQTSVEAGKVFPGAVGKKGVPGCSFYRVNGVYKRICY